LVLPYIFAHAVSIIKKFSRDIFVSERWRNSLFSVDGGDTVKERCPYGGTPVTSGVYPSRDKKFYI
jgi:hypothetical protein